MATDVGNGIMERCWKERPSCSECGHGSYLYGCDCVAQNCICRKRRTLNEQLSERSLLPAVSSVGAPLASLVPVMRYTMRVVGRVAYGAGLENQRGVTALTGSNPVPPAQGQGACPQQSETDSARLLEIQIDRLSLDSGCRTYRWYLTGRETLPDKQV